MNQCHIERENFIKEIALVRSEERNFYIKELEKITKRKS